MNTWRKIARLPLLFFDRNGFSITIRASAAISLHDRAGYRNDVPAV